jgi:hypothetical protein
MRRVGRTMSSKSSFFLATILMGSAAWLPGSASAQETFTLQTINSTGTNTSQGTAQMLDLSDATNGLLFEAALTAFNAKNSDTIRQNATSFTPGGQLVSPQFFPFGGPSIPVSSNVAVVGHLTANGTAGAINYFGFAETAGAQIGLNGRATSPPNQATKLFLYDNNGDLVAIGDANAPDGRSAISDFAVPAGGDGTWQTAITQGLSDTSPANYLLQLQMPYTALSPFTTNVIGSGQEKNGLLGAYDVNAEAGDNLSFDLHPSTPSAETMLRLYDGKGNLVALASQNGSDGFSSIIDFLVSSAHGEAGGWKIVVAPVPGETLPQAFSYDLTIQGFSGLGRSTPRPFPSPRPG